MNIVKRIKSFFNGNTNQIITPIAQTSAYNSYEFVRYGLNLSEYYNRVPELRAIIDQQADMCSKIRLQGNSRALAKLNQPNYLQTYNEFINMAYKQFRLYQVLYLYFRKPSGFNESEIGIDKTDIFILPFDQVKIRLQYNRITLYEAEKLSDIIEKIEFIDNGISTEIDIDRLLIINESGINLKDSILGNSRLKAATDSLDNLLAISESKNEFAINRGANGIISPEQPRTDSTIFSPSDTDNIQSALKEYGMLKIQKKYFVSPYPVRYQKTVLSPKELDFDSMILREKINLSDLLGHNIILLNELANSTFNNYDTARKVIYENTIIPVFETILAGLNDVFGLKGSKQKVQIDKSSIEALQQDRKVKSEIDKLNIENIVFINESLKNNVITYESALKMCIELGYSLADSEQFITKPIIITL